MTKLLIVRVRGQVHVRHDIARALQALNLRKRHHATIVEETPSMAGQLWKIRSFVTWGPVSAEIEKKLSTRLRNKKFFALQPPRKGYGRKGIKMPFSKGGALGDRNDKINDLASRMM
jgi:large subunit ribosomal protein L30